MINVILRLTVSSILYIIITALLWRYWSRHEHSRGLKIAIGIIYGLCCVASTHLGVAYREMVLNVRDVGALAAGLFFDPVSGILAGLIGGAERYLVGRYLYTSSLTTIACSLSTILAGILSAVLNVVLYKGKRPTAGHCLFIGAVMEVFHMYAVLFTNREEMNMAFKVVKRCSVPMSVFCGLCLMGCTICIGLSSGSIKDSVPLTDFERTPIAQRFNRRLLIVTLAVFAINHLMDYNFQSRTTYQETERNLRILIYECTKIWEDSDEDVNKVVEIIPYITMAKYEGTYYLIFDNDKNVITSLYNEEMQMDSLENEDFTELIESAGKGVIRGTLSFYGDSDCLLITEKLGNNLSVTIGWPFSLSQEAQTRRLYEIFLSDVLLFTVLYLLISVLVETLVCKNLRSVNGSLQKIIEGDLNEKVEVRDSLEFVHLSDDINQTVSTLKGYINESEKRMEQELKFAAFIQESALPHVFTFPRSDFELHAIMKPARYVGGDFYDFFFADADKLTLVIADVSGKGIPAAMFMMRAKTAIGSAALSGKSPAEMLFEVNNNLCEGNEAEMFVTAWVGIIDLKTGIMKCANAGHEYPVLCRAGGDYELIKDKHSLVLGAMKHVRMTEYTLAFEPGDRLFVYTDGVPEAIDKKENQYGTDRLITKLNTLKIASQEHTLNEELEDIEKFVGEAEQFDDITMLGFTYYGEERRG